MRYAEDLPMWRLQAARTLAWALLLGGWVGVGSVAQAVTSGPMAAFAWLALWLLALGAAVQCIGGLELRRASLRAMLLCAGGLAAWCLVASPRASAAPWLLLAIVGWAALIALASSTVRACRLQSRVRARSPAGAAASGAFLAWGCVGDITDLRALLVRLAVLALIACGVLAALMPKTEGARGGCRAGLFDCQLPAWTVDDWRSVQRWPVSLAALAMLPMMCGIPWMVGLCRSEWASPQAVLGLHFAVMFVPAVLAVGHPFITRHAPAVCAALLVIGAANLVVRPGASAWWVLAVAHGAAWSLAWASRLEAGPRPARAAQHMSASPLRAAAFNATFAMAIGSSIAIAGLPALGAWHVALGAVAAVSMLRGFADGLKNRIRLA